MNIEHERRRSRVAARLLLGLAACLVLAAVGLVAFGGFRPNASPTAQPSPTSGMVITNAHARLIALGGPVSVTATITNDTRADDWLVGGSSPIASTAGIYATSCACDSTDGTGLAGKSLMPSWLIASTQAIELRAGDGEMLLVGMTQPVVGGQSISVTFKFTHAPPTTVDVVVASSFG